MGKERSSYRSLTSVSSTFRNTMERKEKRKAVPRVSDQFRVLSEKKEIWEKKEAVPGVSHQFEAISEIQWKEKKREKQFLESAISFKYFQKYNGKKRKEKTIPRI